MRANTTYLLSLLALVALLVPIAMKAPPGRRACLEGGVHLGQSRRDFERFMQSQNARLNYTEDTCYYTESAEIDPYWDEPFGMKVFWSGWAQTISNAGGSFRQVGLLGGPSVRAHATVTEIMAVLGPPTRRTQERLWYDDLQLELHLHEGLLDGGHLGDGSQAG